MCRREQAQYTDKMASRNYNPKSDVDFRRVVFSFVANSDRAGSRNNCDDVLQGNHLFEDGLLLNAMEKGVLFPYVHYTELPDKRKPSMILLESESINNGTNVKQGLYYEIDRFGPGVTITNGVKTSVPFTALIFMGFKTMDHTFNEVLEDTWKDWTGARLVYLYLPDEFGLSKLSFYRKVSPKDVDVFMYVMTVECESVTADNRIKLLDIVQRLRTDRMMGYLSVYRAHERPPSTPSVINGLLSETADTHDDVTAATRDGHRKEKDAKNTKHRLW